MKVDRGRLNYECGKRAQNLIRHWWKTPQRNLDDLEFRVVSAMMDAFDEGMKAGQSDPEVVAEETKVDP